MNINSTTTKAGIGIILFALGNYLTGKMDAVTAVGFAVTGLLGIFAQDARPKTNTPTQDDNLPKAG